jgi:lambda repressor-like predicted transcriptional regulator
MVELVRLYSNPEAGLETLPKLLVKATSSPRPHERPASRQTQVRLDSRQTDALATAYEEGKTIKELAAHFGIHRVTVKELLRRHGVELRRAGLASDDVTAASLLYADGWSLAKLGHKFGVDAATVWRALRTSGVTRRTPAGR